MNEPKLNGDHPFLHLAYELRRYSIFKFLVEKGANINVLDKYGDTVLHIASKEGQSWYSEILIKKGALLEVLNAEGNTPLQVAVENGHQSVCTILLKKNASIEVMDKNNLTLLQKTCLSNNDRMCKFLLNSGANKEVTTAQGRTSLHLACEKGYLSICELLINSDANINARDVNGVTPLMIVCKEGHQKIFALLMKRKNLIKEVKDDLLEGTALHWACKHNRVHFCKELIAIGFNPNEPANTLSLLHLAIKNNSQELFELFLEKQTNVNMPDKNGSTPLHLAVELGYSHFVEQFLLKKDKKNVDINAKTIAGKTPLHFAIENSKVESVRLLLKYGALPNEEDVHHKTPLMNAAEKHQLENCQLIVNKLPTFVLSKDKKFLQSLVIGHVELEKLFDSNYGRLVLSDEREENDDHEKQSKKSSSVEKAPTIDNPNNGRQQSNPSLLLEIQEIEDPNEDIADQVSEETLD